MEAVIHVHIRGFDPLWDKFGPYTIGSESDTIITTPLVFIEISEQPSDLTQATREKEPRDE